MKKVVLSMAAVMAVSIPSFAADDLASAFKEGKVSGQFRAFYINRDVVNSHYHRDGFSLGGKMGFETAPVSGLSAGAMFYTTNKIDGESKVLTHNDKTLFNSQDEGYTYLGQAYLNYKRSNTALKVGRQELNTPMAGGDDARMLPNTFEAAVLTNSDIKDTTLVAAHVTAISYGTFSNAYQGAVTAKSQSLALSSGYGYDTSDFKNGKFQSMSHAALGSTVKNSGVSAVAAIYKGIPNLTAQVWDYYAYDILNLVYAQADYSWKCLLNPAIGMTGSVQYIKENGIGDKLAGTVHSQYYAGQLAAKYANTTVTGAYSVTGKDSGSENYGIISPWGGMPAFTQAMVTRHQFMADTTAYKLAVTQNLKELTGMDLTGTVYHATFFRGAEGAYATNVTTRESGFDLIANVQGVKGLQLRLRGNYQRDFGSTADNRDEYRLIANYNF